MTFLSQKSTIPKPVSKNQKVTNVRCGVAPPHSALPLHSSQKINNTKTSFKNPKSNQCSFSTNVRITGHYHNSIVFKATNTKASSKFQKFLWRRVWERHYPTKVTNVRFSTNVRITELLPIFLQNSSSNTKNSNAKN